MRALGSLALAMALAGSEKMNRFWQDFLAGHFAEFRLSHQG
jgi:hypothetical protein